MAYLISGGCFSQDLSLYNHPIKIVSPSVRTFLKSQYIQNLVKNQTDSQKMINHVCKRYSKQQSFNIIYKQEKEIGQKIKKKLKDSKDLNRKSVQSFFKDENLKKRQSESLGLKKYKRQKINMKVLMQGMPQNLKLQTKYRSQINIKLKNIQQAKQIQSQKQNYQNWINNNYKSSNSPIFNRMVFILDKLSQKNKKQKGQKNSQLQNVLILDKINKKKHKRVKSDLPLIDSSLGCEKINIRQTFGGYEGSFLKNLKNKESKFSLYKIRMNKL